MSAAESPRSYLVRAIHDWALDNGLTPHLVVNAAHPEIDAPDGYAQQGRIVFNIHPRAVQGLDLGREWISFSARFSGMSRLVRVPVGAVLAIYVRESGRGISFGAELDEAALPAVAPAAPTPSAREKDTAVSRPKASTTPPKSPTPGKPRKVSHLRRVK